MRILIVGSGVIGVTAAYVLQQRGHQVTVVDRRHGPGEETSFANGALLVPSMPEPWNSPGCWRVLLASLARSDAPLQLRAQALPAMIPWGIRFLRNSSRARSERNTRHNLRLALHSLEVMEGLRDETGVDYGRSTRGSLRIFRDPAAHERAAAAAQQLVDAGLHYRKLSRQQTLELEPALLGIEERIAGALHYEVDEVGDAYLFCVRMTELARRLGVDFRFGTDVHALASSAGRVAAIVANERPLVADRYLIAAGSYTAPLLRSLGIRLPVCPAKGYSLTLDAPTSTAALRIPIVDDQLHAAFTPLGGALRIVSTAEFAGYDLSLTPARCENLLGLVRGLLPGANLNLAAAKFWCGLRPMSADGVPLIGPTSHSNVWVSTGHGHLGWTLAAGSASLVADLIQNTRPAVDPTPYDPRRFARRQ